MYDSVAWRGQANEYFQSLLHVLSPRLPPNKTRQAAGGALLRIWAEIHFSPLALERVPRAVGRLLECPLPRICVLMSREAARNSVAAKT